MTIGMMYERQNGWSHFRVMNGLKTLFTDENGYVPLPDYLEDEEVESYGIEGNTIVVFCDYEEEE